jgi:hypothetical protein
MSSHRPLATNFPTGNIGRAVDYERVKREAYHGQGIAIIDLSDSRIAWADRTIIEDACKRLYGQKRVS